MCKEVNIDGEGKGRHINCNKTELKVLFSIKKIVIFCNLLIKLLNGLKYEW